MNVETGDSRFSASVKYNVNLKYQEFIPISGNSMNLLSAYGKAISSHPWVAIGVIVIITGFFGYFTTQYEFGSDEDSFAPEDEVSRANIEVREEFGSQRGQLTVLIRSDGNVLSRESLLAQLDLMERALNSSVSDLIVTMPEDPDGFSSPAEIVVQSIFYIRSFSASQEYMGNGSTNLSCLDREKLINAFIGKGFSLTVDEQREVLRGGEVRIKIDCLPYPLVLDFDPYRPEDLPVYTAGAPMAVALEFLLSKEYVTGGTAAKQALFVISTDPDLEPARALKAEKELDSMAEDVEMENEGLNFITIGDEIVSEKINEASGSSMGTLFMLALLMVIIVLLFVFRDWFEIVINVVALFMAIIWVFGTGGLLGFENNPSLTTVPVLVIALGIDYGIHLTLRYREEVRKGKSVGEAITRSEASVGFAILLATVTTLVGFLSNLSASSPGIRIFGILNAAGILAAFVIMMTFVPAARVIRERRKERKGKPLLREKGHCGNIWGWAEKRAKKLGIRAPGMVGPEGPGILARVLSGGASLARFPAIVIAVVVLMTGVGIYGGLQLEPTFDFRDFLPDGLEVTDATKSVVDDFDFSSEEGYVLAEGDVTQPEVLLSVIDVKERALEGEDVVSSEPFGSPLDLGATLTNPALPTYDANFSAVWHLNLDGDFDGVIDENLTSTNVSAVYDAMFLADKAQASRVLRKDGDDYTGMVVRIPVNSRGGARAEEVRDQVIYAAAPMEELEGGMLKRVTPTGGPLVQQAVLEAIAGGQTRSIALTFLASLVILTVIFLISKRSLLLGVVTMLPLIMVLAWTTGGMYYFGIPLNVVTVTISAITVGLGIDYGVHITQRFLEDRDRVGDGICALSVAVSHTGSALFGSMMTTVIGFAILSFAIIPPLAQFGQVTALSVTFAFLASVFVLPTLLLLWLRGNQWYRRRFRGEEVPEMTGECVEEKV